MASKNSTSGGSSAASFSAPPPHYNDQGVRDRWPVLVHRLQSHRGWEVYSDPDKDATTTPVSSSNSSASNGKKTSAAAAKTATVAATSSDGNSTNDNSSKEVPKVEEELTAAPRPGCIEVRKMRLRIQLFQQHTPWDPNHHQPHRQRRARRVRKEEELLRPLHDDEEPTTAEAGTEKTAETETNPTNDTDGDGDSYDEDTPGTDGWNNNSLLVRRRNTLLVTTRRGMGAVVFRFASTRDCIDFCDRLVYLNREYLMPPSRYHDEGDGDDEATTPKVVPPVDEGHVNGMDKREIRREEMIRVKRRKCTPMESSIAPNEDEDETPPAEEDEIRYQRQEEIMSYIVRLAHSEDFRGFVDELERGLELAEDTAAMHAAFGCVPREYDSPGAEVDSL